jgi:hypothetical protein
MSLWIIADVCASYLARSHKASAVWGTVSVFLGACPGHWQLELAVIKFAEVHKRAPLLEVRLGRAALPVAIADRDSDETAAAPDSE